MVIKYISICHDSQTDGLKDGMTDGRVKVTYLLCYHRQHFQFDPIELVKARPRSGRGKTLEELKQPKTNVFYSQYLYHKIQNSLCIDIS